MNTTEGASKDHLPELPAHDHAFQDPEGACPDIHVWRAESMRAYAATAVADHNAEIVRLRKIIRRAAQAELTDVARKALDLECGNNPPPVETGCVHPLGALFHHGFVSGKLHDYRCNLCNTVVNIPGLDSRIWAAARIDFQNVPTAKASEQPLCDGKARVIYEHGEPTGVRDDGGYLCFFNRVTKWPGQEERYRDELALRARHAEAIANALNGAGEQL